MKLKMVLMTAVAWPMAVSAQIPPSMTEQDMQKMMSAVQEVQACYQQIDQQELNALQQRSQQFMSDIQSLCKAGSRSTAQEKAMSYSREMMADKVVKQLRGCAEKLPESLKSMAKSPVDYQQYVKDMADMHVCDYENYMP